MEKGYSAFGLALGSSFSLPGMVPVGVDGASALALDLETAAELQAAWTGPLSAGPWRGRLGDGHELTIAWGVGGDLLFDYSGGARFRLNPARDRLGCAPQDPAGLDWQRVLLSRVLPNVSLARGCEALHACAVETPAGVVAIAAPSGTGKSTLMAELVRRGSTFFTDDVLVLSRGAEMVEAHPGSPHANIATGAAGSVEAEELGTVLASFADERWVEVRRAPRSVRPVVAIALLERGPGLSLGAEALPRSPLTLAAHMLGLPDEQAEREASRFVLYSDLVESTALLRLTGAVTDTPAALADALEGAIEANRPAGIRAVA